LAWKEQIRDCDGSAGSIVLIGVHNGIDLEVERLGSAHPQARPGIDWRGWQQRGEGEGEIAESLANAEADWMWVQG